MADMDIDSLLNTLANISTDSQGVPKTQDPAESEDDLMSGGVPWPTQSSDRGAEAPAPPKIRMPPKGGSPIGMGLSPEESSTQSVSLEDTYKSNVQGNQPDIGSVYNPLGGVSLDGMMDDHASTDMSYTTTETVQEEIPNPYAFDNFTSESTEVVEETTNNTKKLVMVAGIGILVVLVVIVGAITIGKKFNSKSRDIMPPSTVNEQPSDPSQGAQYAPQSPNALPEYTGPKIQTASPESLATSSDYFDDIMSVDKQIQVENGTVECYFLGTPKFFGKPVKIPVSVEDYNASGPLDIVKIRYNVVRISGTDYIIDPIVIAE